MIDPRDFARRALILAGALACSGTFAQAPTPESGASAADRAQKESDRTLYWIRVLSDKPTPKPAAAKPAAAPAPARALAATPAPPVAVKTAAVVAPATPASPTPTPTPVAPPVAAPATAVASVTAPAATARTATADAAVGAAAIAPAATAGLAAPAMTPAVPAEVASAPEEEEVDPGLVMTRSVDPQFPINTMRRLRKGQVEVRFEVGPDGQVDEVSVVHSTNAGLNDAALDAVRQWRFKPTPHGHTALVDLAFNLDS